MAFVLKDRVRMTTATTGTGAISLGFAVANAAQGYFRTFAAAGVANGDTLHYVIEDGAAWEIGLGTYTASGTVMARALVASSTGSLLSLSGTAEVFIAALSDYLTGASAAQYQALTPNKLISTDSVSGGMAEVTLTDAAMVAWVMSGGVDFTVTLAGNRTLGNPSGTTVGKKGRIRVVQDGTGSRTLALSSNLKTAGGAGITLSTAAGSVDYLDYDCVSATNIRIALSKAWA